QGNTQDYTVQKEWQTKDIERKTTFSWKRLDHLQKSGIRLRKAESGTVNTLRELVRICRCITSNVKNVAEVLNQSCLLPNFAPINVLCLQDVKAETTTTLQTVPNAATSF